MSPPRRRSAVPSRPIPAPQRRRAPSRRRARPGIIVVLVVVVFAALLLGHDLQHNPKPTRASSKSKVTKPVRLVAAEASCTFVDSSRTTKNYVTEASTAGRRLVTQIYYPTLSLDSGHGGASSPVPATRYGPYPTIFFAEGYGIDPSSYAELLDSWVRDGFVVVAPLFPDADAAAVAAIHGSFADEADWPNETEDLTFVTHRVLADSAGTPGCSVLRGLVDRSELGLAGQSDGATVVAMLAYDQGTLPGTTTTYRSLSAGLDYRAAAVLSGQADGADSYASTPSSPAALFVQSATDQCNLPQWSVDLYSSLDQSDRWFLAIRSADHLTPYEGEDAAAFDVVSKVTGAFFASELRGHRPSPTFLADGNAAPSVATLVTGSALPSFIEGINITQSSPSCYVTSVG